MKFFRFKKVLVTGGYGFIGSNFLRLFRKAFPQVHIVNLDVLTYAGKLDNLKGFLAKRYRWVKANIADTARVRRLFAAHDFDAVIHFAAETHVDNSIKGPRVFVETNVSGTANLLTSAWEAWQKKPGWKTRKRFIQISTDEVYGSLPENRPDLKFTEKSPVDPRSPYSAAKAGADHLALAYYHTYGMPVIITRCSNNYGPCQDEEKLIPLMITQALKNKPLPVYGDGKNIREWIHVEDHCRALITVLLKGQTGEVYNIGSGQEMRNIDLVRHILGVMRKPETLITYVTDRPGHDRRYALDSSKIRRKLGWTASKHYLEGLAETVDFYRTRRIKR